MAQCSRLVLLSRICPVIRRVHMTKMSACLSSRGLQVSPQTSTFGFTTATLSTYNNNEPPPNPGRIRRAYSVGKEAETRPDALQNDVTSNGETSGNASPSDIIASFDAEMSKKFQVLKLEFDVWSSMGYPVPQHVSDETWLHLLQKCPSTASRRKYLRFMMIKENHKKSDQAKKALRKMAQLKKQEEEAKAGQSENFQNVNRCVRPIKKKDILQYQHHQLMHAMVFGPPLVFDLGFESKLNDRELINLVEQFSECHGFNKMHKEPFSFYLCNVLKNGKVEDILTKKFGSLADVPYTVTDQSYTDVFPKERLVYLSPNSRTTLKSFDHDDVYIVGGIVDRTIEEPVTMAKAKEERLRTAKLPLDLYLRWKLGSKSLCLDQITKILLELKESQDWRRAFQHVPARKFDWR